MVTISRVHVDYRFGQHDFILVAKLDDQVAGTLEYAEFEGQVNVHMINVMRRREGVGTALVVELQRLYPDVEIDFGIVTPEGEKLLKALEWNVVENPEKKRLEAEWKLLDTTLRDYARRADAVLDMPDEVKKAFIEEVSDWNELSDRADEIQNTLWKCPSEFRYVVGRKVANVNNEPAAQFAMAM